jgi:DNA-binding beta-propeller fold protein YncE
MGLEFEAVRAPELHGTAWFNVARPLSWEDLRGNLVLLSFWTYSCIGCLHVLEDLAYLERKYAGRPFAVISVLSPMFSSEDDPESARLAVVRCGITHPVVLDRGRVMWDAYAVRDWPTLVLVDPRGYVLGRAPGEGNRERLEGEIDQALELLVHTEPSGARPLPLELESASGAVDPAAPLRFPGKVLADAASNALYIADSGHHRLVRAALDGRGADVIGSGEPGVEDGDFATARFRCPQGIALDAANDCLYIADTGNHLLRRVDLAARTVAAVAGTGEPGRGTQSAGRAREVALNSPWDLCLLDGKLFIAMAGLQQIWFYDPERQVVGVFAGSGTEGRADGLASSATFAQPSGITTDGMRLFVADSQSSCVRVIELDQASGMARVRTLAGGDRSQFGDRDGRGGLARMQHPLGIAWVPVGAPGGGSIYIADTYNHKVRRLEPSTRDLTSLTGRGGLGELDGSAATARFREPSGLSYAKERLYVADTNNGAIRIVTLPDGRVTTLQIVGIGVRSIHLPG